MLKNLKAEMARLGISQKALAEAIDVTERTVNNWITGDCDVPLRKAFAIRKAFFHDLTLEYLFEISS